jgi:hypothetical protein
MTHGLFVVFISHLSLPGHCYCTFSRLDSIYIPVKKTSHLHQIRENSFMVFFVANLSEEKMNQGSQSTTTSTKIERRLIEKNRRNQMKILYSKLNVLLPNQNSKVSFSLSLSVCVCLSPSTYVHVCLRTCRTDDE